MRSILYAPEHVVTTDLRIQCTGKSFVNERVVNTLVTFVPLKDSQRPSRAPLFLEPHIGGMIDPCLKLPCARRTRSLSKMSPM